MGTRIEAKGQIGSMDENPYKSPESELSGEKLRKSAKQFPPAIVCGYLGFAGPFVLEVLLVRLLLNPGIGPTYALLLSLPIPGVVGGMLAGWAWRHPDSKWVVRVAIGMAFLPFLLSLFRILLY